MSTILPERYKKSLCYMTFSRTSMWSVVRSMKSFHTLHEGCAMLTRLPGTQDFLDLVLYNRLLEQIRTHFMRAGFHEIATPIIEPTELFQRSLGTETDVITKELYYVISRHTPPEEQYKLCLRPEATAATMRAYLNNTIVAHPWSVFTIGPMFRHERHQKGRYRQFHQANIELVNTSSITQDARLIMLLDRFFTVTLGLRAYALLINFMGCHADREKFIEQLRPFIEKHKEKLCESCIRRSQTNILRIFDCKEQACRDLYATAPHITDHLCAQCTHEWSHLQTTLEQLGVTYSHQPLLVRGLDYYEKTVFEFVSTNLGAQNTFCGGGRYSRIASELGAAQDVPAVGAALGIERLLMLIEELGAQANAQPPLYLIVPLSREQHIVALHLADLLNEHGYTAEPLLEEGSLKNMLRLANKRGAHTCLLIGSEEQESKTVLIKRMLTGAEQRVAQAEVVAYLKT